MADVQVVGGGLAGLVAAIECAEGGASVTLHEATAKLGGRARSLERDGFVTNQGPHAFYVEGPASAWIEQRGLTLPLTALKPGTIRFRYDGRTHARPSRFIDAHARLPAGAPDDVSFGEWARTLMPDRDARLIEGGLTLTMYDGAPGRYAAGSVRAVLTRTQQPGVVQYIEGGWRVLADRLAGRAEELGVDVRLRSRVQELPAGTPAIVCVSPRAAANLLGHPEWDDGQAVALRDLGLRTDGDRAGPSALLDVDTGVYVARYSDTDPSLAPRGHDLLQCAAGLRPGEEAADAHTRIEEVLDAAYPRWRSLAVMDRRVTSPSPGPRDGIGRSWRDRPAIDHGDGIFLAGDWVAAPGFLSEICFTSAQQAAQGALAAMATPKAGK